MPAKKVYTGVDYIRLTDRSEKPYDSWLNIAMPEYGQEEKAGRKPHFRWVMGYYGRAAEHVFVGKGPQGSMVQLSGTLAYSHWRAAAAYSTKATRIDLQVTWPVDDEPGLYVREMYQVGQLRKGVNGRPPDLQLVDTPSGAKMLTVGSRQSQLYGRMYDKFRESRMPEYEQCVRWEVEIKAEQAVDLLAYLQRQEDELATVRAIVEQFWKVRGMTPFWEVFESMYEPPPIKRSKTDETKLAWLINQVRPSLVQLKEHGRLMDAVKALLDDVVDDDTIKAVLLLIEKERGD